MRGHDAQQASMWSYLSPERRVPQEHPLRPIRAMVETVLAELSPRFALLYSQTGRPSIPPEKLLRALLLQILYTVRSERQLMEQLDYNLLFRWFVGLNIMGDVAKLSKLCEAPHYIPASSVSEPLGFSTPGRCQALELSFTLDTGRCQVEQVMDEACCF